MEMHLSNNLKFLKIIALLKIEKEILNSFLDHKYRIKLQT